jgi:hypothetical protein
MPIEPLRYRVLVTGDRHWNCAAVASSVVARLLDRHGVTLRIVRKCLIF